jgi:hypothetical protein
MPYPALDIDDVALINRKRWPREIHVFGLFAHHSCRWS